MVRMVIVDDKEDIVRGIEKLGGWGNMGIEVAGTANNGKDALEIIRRTDPHILITDIRMPVMDGLELTEKALQLKPQLKIILLSGYDDFAYAQKAIRLGAQEYLLKPTPIDTIVSAVRKVQHVITAETRSYLETEKLRQRVRESMPLLRNEYFTALLTLEKETPQDMAEKFRYLGVDIGTRDFRVLVFALDAGEELHLSFERYNLMMNGVIDKLEEVFTDKFRHIVFKSRQFEVAVIANVTDGDPTQVFSLAETARDQVADAIGVSVSAGIGRYYPMPGSISLSYQEACRALENRFLLGRGIVVAFDDVDIGLPEPPTAQYAFEREAELIKYIQIGADERVQELFEAYVDMLQQQNTGHPRRVRSCLCQLLLTVCRELARGGIDTQPCIGDELECAGLLEKAKSLEEARGRLSQVLSAITGYIARLRQAKEKKSIDIISAFIDQNYIRDITLNDISRCVYLSPSYISMLIKNHFGENFVERITRLRMEKAKLLLLENGSRVYEVAEQVGYADRRYFSDIFKKTVGMTPKEYADRYRSHR